MRLTGAILFVALWASGAVAQLFNPIVSGPHESAFCLPSGPVICTAGGVPLSFFSQNPAIAYDNGGQGIAYNVPSPGCSRYTCATGSTAYRPDAINFKSTTFGTGFPYQLGFSSSPNSYNYTVNISQAGPYIITLWVGSASSGGSWNVLIDNQVVGNVVTPNTGSYATLAASQSSAFNATLGTHVLTLAWDSGDATGNSGDLVAWQGSVSSGGLASIFDVSRNTGTNFSFSGNSLTATELTAAPTNSNYSAFTTGFHFDRKRFFRFTIGTESSGCGQGLGVASSTEINGSYLGHGGGNSFGIFKDGGTSINNGSMGNTGITFAPGDMIDIIIDPIAKTIQEVKNGGTPSGAFSISTLSTQNVSPAISTCAINDSMTFNGNPTGVSYTGAIAWDAVDSPIFTSLSITCGTSCSFVPGTSSAIGTVTANISSGPNTPAWSLKTTGTDSATGLITCYPNASGYFSINGSSGIITVSAAAPANTYKVCAQDTQSGVGGSPFSQAFSLTGGSPPPATFVANFSDVHQTMDGFGGSDAWRSDMNPYNLDAYFCINASDPGCSGPGIGLTLLREGTSSTDGITQSDTVPDPPPPDGSISSRTAAIGAKARGATLFATPWIVTTSNYTAAAQGIVDWVNSQTAAGIPVYAVATQNEPDCGCNGGYVWNPGQVAALVDVLGPMLHSLSPPVKMMAPEVAFPPSDFINYVAALESDSTANAQTDIFTTHQYGDITGSPSDGTRHMWQTEVSPGSSWDPSIGNAMGESMHWMYDAIVTAGVNAWSYWQLACGSGCDNGGLAGDFSPSSPMSDNVPKRYYAVGNWSKFVRPGWVRVGVTGSASGISPIAFKDPVSGKFAIVVLDYNGSGDSNVTFGIQNATISGNVTPYVTSGTPIGVIGTDGNLSAGSVSSGIPASLPVSGGVFTSALPYGVTTFVGQSH